MITCATLRDPTAPFRGSAHSGIGALRSSTCGTSLPSRLRLIAVLLVLVVGIVLDEAFVPTVGRAPVLVIASAVAATVAGAALAGGVALVSGIARIGLDAGHSQLLLATVLHAATMLVICEIVIAVCALRQRHHTEINTLRAVSEIAQGVVLRPLPDRLGPLRIASVYRAAEAHATVGSDLYGAVRIPGATRVLIGDVRGKGLQGIHEVAAALGAFREAARCYPTLPDVAAHLEASIRSHLEEAVETDQEAGERFVTALVLEIPDDHRVVHTVSCGHPAPLLYSGGSVTLLKPQHCSPPLGLGGLSARDYQQDTFPFTAEDLLMLYTDGITEARDGTGAFYPLKERVASWAGTDPAQLLQYVQGDLSQHIGGPMGDDAAMVALRRSSDTVTSRTGGPGAVEPSPPTSAGRRLAPSPRPSREVTTPARTERLIAKDRPIRREVPRSQPDGGAPASAQHRVVVLMFDGVQSLDVTGPLDVYTAANEFGGNYRLTTVSPSGRPVRTTAGLRLVPDRALGDIDFAVDTLLVPGGPRWWETVADRPLIQGITRLADDSDTTTVGAVCAGAFSLAETGALDGRRAATHWKLAADLAARYPRVQVDTEALFVRDGRYITSAGVTAGIDLTLSLVERDLGPEVARAAAKYLVVFMARPGGQSQFSVRQQSPHPQNSPLRGVLDRVAADPRGDHSLQALGAGAGLSPRHLTRLFRTEIGSTAGEYVKRIRLEAAQALLEGGTDSLGTVARRSGFRTEETMRRAFHSRLGVSPGTYRDRFRTTRPDAVPGAAERAVSAGPVGPSAHVESSTSAHSS